ncbi:Replication termination factor 2 [Sorochytrium milnesiophthora]
MGADGGSIPRRNELVKTKQKEQKADPHILAITQWFFCALSRQPLQQPIVSCGLGKLYNKDAVLQYLIDKAAFGEASAVCPHIASLKDVVTLNLMPNPSGNASAANDVPVTAIAASGDPTMTAQFICPVSGREMNGKSRFSYLWSCGCVFAEQAFRMVPSTVCMTCSRPFSASDDVIPLNPRPEELETLRALLPARKKASKKAKKLAADNGDEPKSDQTVDKAKSNGDSVKSLKRKLEADSQRPQRMQKVDLTLPNLDHLAQAAATSAQKSAAIKSIYAKKDPNAGQSAVCTDYMTRTFTRYA